MAPELIQAVRNAFGMGGERSVTNVDEARKNQIAARSGNNIRFPDSTDVGKSFADTLDDAVSFFQKEFKTTPRANIGNFSIGKKYGPATTGVTNIIPDSAGQHNIRLKFLSGEDEDTAKYTAGENESEHWRPYNSGNSVAGTPIHELGHALYATLFPFKDTSSNANRKYDVANNGESNLVMDAIKDMGIDASDEDEIEAQKDEISGYAVRGDDGETIAEALTDYYFNRQKAAPLSRAIVNRLKTHGNMYAMRQAGGVDTDPSADNFIKNLRRFNVIQ